MTTVNPVQTTTYYLTNGNNPIIFGTGTGIDVSSFAGSGVFGSSAQSWSVTNKGAISASGEFGFGVYLGAGGSVGNKAGATISAGWRGVAIGSQAAGTVTNAGKISASSGDYDTGSYAVYLGAGGSVTNEAGATISASSKFGCDGVLFGGGGTVTNKAGATISAYGNSGSAGVSVFSFGVGLTVQNFGNIVSSGDGVQLVSPGGAVNNGRGGTITGAISGVYAGGGPPTLVTNAGAISGHLYGIDLAAGGLVTNKAGGTISGGHYGFYKNPDGYYQLYNFGGGVRIAGGLGSVTNAGTINSDGKYGIYLGAGGSVSNGAGATISGHYVVFGPGIEIAGGAGTVTNAGDISGCFIGVELQAGGSFTNKGGGTISASIGVELQAGGSVTNKAGGTINGGISLSAGGSVTNGGTIHGYRGVELAEGGLVTNEAGGAINSYGQGSTGVLAFGPATVTNAGAITAATVGIGGNAVALYGGGSITNKAGATITGGYGILLFSSSGTVTNAGDITGYISPGGNLLFATGIYIEAGGSVNNQGTGAISGYHTGVWLRGGGGSVTNKAGGAISAHDIGILAEGKPVTVTNAGDISGEGGVVAIGSAATVANSGAITGTTVGSVTFRGTVETLGDGVFMNAGGAATNKAGGTINGAGDGVYIAGGGSVTNAGTISGTIASVEFAGAGANTLTLETGSTLNGDAIGSTASGATNALILQGHGTANNNFDDFDTLSVQANGNWTLGGDSTFGATTVSGSLIVAGDVSGGPTTLGDPAGDVAKLVIASTGTWNILDDSSIGLSGSTPSFVSNSGLFEKTGGSGTSAIAPAVTNTGTIEVTAGTLDLQGAVTGKGIDKVSGASTLEFDSAVAATQTVDFLGGPSAVDLLDPNAFFGKIADFASPGTVQLPGDWVFSGFSENAAGTLGTLTLASGASHHAFDFVGDYTASDFKITSGATTTIAHT
jgi:hypothetical protein